MSGTAASGECACSGLDRNRCWRWLARCSKKKGVRGQGSGAGEDGDGEYSGSYEIPIPNPQPPTPAMRPNILFLLIDCLRADAVTGARRRARTPTIDRLVRSGVACTQAIASASSTTPCVASLLTGTYSFVHGIRSIFGLKLNPSVSSLVEILRRHGYQTYAEVSGPLFPETGLDRGFDSYRFREGSAYLSTAWGADLRQRLQRAAFTPPWFLLLHLWELHHHRHILPEFRSRAYGRNRYERALSCLD